jgi:Ca2+-binding RTX toxin-like protein
MNTYHHLLPESGLDARLVKTSLDEFIDKFKDLPMGSHFLRDSRLKFIPRNLTQTSFNSERDLTFSSLNTLSSNLTENLFELTTTAIAPLTVPLPLDARIEKPRTELVLASSSISNQALQANGFTNTTFTEVSLTAGIHHSGQSWGSAWGDFNGDGHPDLWVNNHRDPDTLYLNQGNGTFEKAKGIIVPPQPTKLDTHASAWADFDNDGDQDLVELTGGGGDGPVGENKLLYVNENGQLVDHGNTLGFFAYREASGRSPLWVDVNHDGRLDLFFGTRFRPNDPTSLPPTIFLQTDKGFRESRKALGLKDIQDGTFGILADLSGDGLPEIILKSKPRAILSLKTLPLQNVASQLLSHTSFTGEDYAAADFNGDLRMDLFVKKSNGDDRLLINQPRVGLTDMTAGSGIKIYPGSSVVAGDFDNDMDVDLFIRTANHEVDPEADQALTVARGTRNPSNILYDNQGNGKFVRFKGAAGALGSPQGSGESVTTADYDSNGFLDLFITNGRSPTNLGPDQLYKNRGNQNHWLEIDLEGVHSNRDGIGSQVLVTAGGISQIRDQAGGMHNRTQNHQRLHFGLAQFAHVSAVEVRWSLGMEQTLHGLGANHILQIREGVGAAGNDTIIGTSRAEFLQGNAGNDTLMGQGGRDTLLGNTGEDTLVAGSGTDWLTGGAGDDHFILPSNVHTIVTDFKVLATEDHLSIQMEGFSDLTAGLLANDKFTLGVGALDHHDRFIYNPLAGDLFYDADGLGGVAQFRIARFTNRPTLASSDLRIVG